MRRIWGTAIALALFVMMAPSGRAAAAQDKKLLRNGDFESDGPGKAPQHWSVRRWDEAKMGVCPIFTVTDAQAKTGARSLRVALSAKEAPNIWKEKTVLGEVKTQRGLKLTPGEKVTLSLAVRPSPEARHVTRLIVRVRSFGGGKFLGDAVGADIRFANLTANEWQVIERVGEFKPGTENIDVCFEPIYQDAASFDKPIEFWVDDVSLRLGEPADATDKTSSK